MNAIRVRRRLDSRVLDLPELEPMVGKTVDIIVLEEQEQEPATVPPRDLSALDAFTKLESYDWNAVERLREISKI